MKDWYSKGLAHKFFESKDAFVKLMTSKIMSGDFKLSFESDANLNNDSFSSDFFFEPVKFNKFVTENFSVSFGKILGIKDAIYIRYTFSGEKDHKDLFEPDMLRAIIKREPVFEHHERVVIVEEDISPETMTEFKRAMFNLVYEAYKLNVPA